MGTSIGRRLVIVRVPSQSFSMISCNSSISPIKGKLERGNDFMGMWGINWGPYVYGCRFLEKTCGLVHGPAFFNRRRIVKLQTVSPEGFTPFFVKPSALGEPTHPPHPKANIFFAKFAWNFPPLAHTGSMIELPAIARTILKRSSAGTLPRSKSYQKSKFLAKNGP
jgi:hypothetical protein